MHHIRLKQTDVLVQEANEGGSHDVPVFAAELHRRLYPIIHHKSQILVNGVRTKIGKLKQEQNIMVSVVNSIKPKCPRVFRLTAAYLRSWTYSEGEKAPWNNFQVELFHG